MPWRWNASGSRIQISWYRIILTDCKIECDFLHKEWSSTWNEDILPKIKSGQSLISWVMVNATKTLIRKFRTWNLAKQCPQAVKYISNKDFYIIVYPKCMIGGGQLSSDVQKFWTCDIRFSLVVEQFKETHWLTSKKCRILEHCLALKIVNIEKLL